MLEVEVSTANTQNVTSSAQFFNLGEFHRHTEYSVQNASKQM